MSSGGRSFGGRGARRGGPFRAAIGRHVGSRQSVAVDHSKQPADQQDGPHRSMRMSSRLGKRRRFSGGRGGLFRNHGGRKRPRTVDARLSIERPSDENDVSSQKRDDEEKASSSTQRVGSLKIRFDSFQVYLLIVQLKLFSTSYFCYVVYLAIVNCWVYSFT